MEIHHTSHVFSFHTVILQLVHHRIQMLVLKAPQPLIDKSTYYLLADYHVVHSLLTQCECVYIPLFILL